MSRSAGEVSRKVLENIKVVVSGTSERGKQAVQNMKVALTKIFQWSKTFAKKAFENMRVAPSQVYGTTKSSAAHLVMNIKAIPSKVVGVALSAPESLASAAQPYVHCIIKVVAPHAESVA